MIAIDGSHNGWRSLVLPLSQRDPLVMQAVISVSTSHVDLNRESTSQPYAPCLASFARSQNHTATNPLIAFHKVVSLLRRQCDLDTTSTDKRHSVLLTILVLLVGVMVNGRSDFPIILRMLESAIAASGGEQKLGTGPVADFIRIQARKYARFAPPLLARCVTH